MGGGGASYNQGYGVDLSLEGHLRLNLDNALHRVNMGRIDKNVTSEEEEV